MGQRLRYFARGAAIGLTIYLALVLVIRRRLDSNIFVLGLSALGFSISVGNLFVYFAERQGKVKSLEDLNRPLTLFSTDSEKPDSRPH